MKYIKEYSNTYYYKISLKEFENLVYPNKSINFIQTEIDKIIKIYQPITINKDQFGARGHISILVRQMRGFISLPRNLTGEDNIEIFKIPDEWYILEHCNMAESTIDRDSQVGCYYYKCDQLEGLLYLLEELIYNK